MSRRLGIYILFLLSSLLFSQEINEMEGEIEILAPLNDPSSEGQRIFVEELLDFSGYVPEKIEVYQTLPNSARVYHVKLDSITGGFIFVRWNKEKKENYVDNKMIDPGLYYNLKAAQEIFRKQVRKKSFSKNDVAIQASDQKKISAEELNRLREEYQLREMEKQLELEAKREKQLRKKRKRDQKREPENTVTDM